MSVFHLFSRGHAGHDTDTDMTGMTDQIAWYVPQLLENDYATWFLRSGCDGRPWPVDHVQRWAAAQIHSYDHRQFRVTGWQPYRCPAAPGCAGYTARVEQAQHVFRFFTTRGETKTLRCDARTAAAVTADLAGPRLSCSIPVDNNVFDETEFVMKLHVVGHAHRVDWVKVE